MSWREAASNLRRGVAAAWLFMLSSGADCRQPPSQTVEGLMALLTAPVIALGPAESSQRTIHASWKTTRGESRIVVLQLSGTAALANTTSSSASFKMDATARYSDGTTARRTGKHSGVYFVPTTFLCKQDDCTFDLYIDVIVTAYEDPIEITWGMDLRVDALDYDMTLSDLSAEWVETDGGTK